LYGRNWDSYYYNGWQYNTNVYSNHRTYEPKNNNNTNNIKSKPESKDISIAFNFLYHIGSSVYVGCAATTVTNLVLPRMRGMAGAFFILTLSMIGLALGPYTLGRLADFFESQALSAGDAMQTAMGLILFILIIPSFTLFMAAKNLKEDEESVIERARALGEDI
jgi:hypothetical protein